jgi:molybdate transport system substrate-binding protein
MRLAGAILLTIATSAGAAEVRVMSAGAVKAAVTAAVPAWERQTGNRMEVLFASAGELRKRLGAGESADLLIVPAENLAEYEKAGLVDATTRVDLGVVSIGAAVRKGAPVPDISTPEAFKRTLTATRSLTYMDPARGTSGKHFDESVLPKLGIRDEVRAKTTFGEGGYIAEKVARGEVEIAVHQMTELLPVEGITIVGPLPSELQKATVYSAVLMKKAANPQAARTLVDHLVSNAGREAFAARGFAAP